MTDEELGEGSPWPTTTPTYNRTRRQPTKIRQRHSGQRRIAAYTWSIATDGRFVRPAAALQTRQPPRTYLSVSAGTMLKSLTSRYFGYRTRCQPVDREQAESGLLVKSVVGRCVGW